MLGHLEFSGNERSLKLYIKDAQSVGKPDGLLHTIECHDVGVQDGQLSDPYGHECKCPPGDYIVGVPMACATRKADGSVTINHPDDPAYGCWFVPLSDATPDGGFAQHGRAGIGIHGGGSDLADPFALEQGWEFTFGCLRCQNKDLEQVLVPFINFIHDHNGEVRLTVVWDV